MKLDDVNNIWNKCDVLIYSPTIEAGVNFDVPYFDKIFGILADMSTSQRSFIQMLNRVRKLTDNEIIINNSDSHNKAIFKLNDVKGYYNYYDAEHQAKNLKSFQKQVIYKNVDNKRVRVETYDNYAINYLYNLIEDGNKQKFYFMAKFKELIEGKGHIIKFNDILTNNNNNDDNKNVVDNTDDKEVEILDELKDKFDEIISSKLISKKEYNFLMNEKKKNKASEFDKIKMTKRYFCDILGTTELNKEDLKFWYYNTYLIKNYNNLLNIDSFIRTNEINNNISFEKLELVQDIINKLGFNNITEVNKYINSDELTNNFNGLMKNNKLFTNKKASMIFFKVRPFKCDDKTTIKQILGFLNSVLYNYSVKIDSKQIRINSKREYVYVIKCLNNVDDILKKRSENNSENLNEITL